MESGIRSSPCVAWGVCQPMCGLGGLSRENGEGRNVFFFNKWLLLKAKTSKSYKNQKVISVNYYDHCILALLRQQRERPEKLRPERKFEPWPLRCGCSSQIKKIHSFQSTFQIHGKFFYDHQLYIMSDRINRCAPLSYDQQPLIVRERVSHAWIFNS